MATAPATSVVQFVLCIAVLPSAVAIVHLANRFLGSQFDVSPSVKRRV